MKTRFTVLIFLACMSINSFVCNAQNSQGDRLDDCCSISSGKISYNDKNIRYDGRVLIDSTAAHLFYPGTSISVTVKNEGSLCAEFSSTGDVFYWIEVDGHEAYKVKSSGLVPLPKQKPPYTVKITLASEGIYHNPKFYGFICCVKDPFPEISRPADKKLKFEFIGNSITCGYGTEVTDRSPFNDSTSNFCHGFAYRTAKAFDAEIMTVARSGIGIYRNYGEKDSALYYGCMPDNYEKLWLDSDKKWDFSKFTPDLLFINLGTNDTWEMSSFNAEKYEKNFRKLMDMVTAHYPTTTVVLLTGSMMGPEALAAVKPILDKLQKDYSTKKRLVYRFDFTPIMGDGADWHPSAAQQEAMSKELIPFVQKILEKR
ncbi:MAG: hypothetical protein J6V74_00210 [Bacteroidales bacterium]|nr:hypothetical protein [Bacteroidales bacterium]